jgi:hypothetical protein
MIPVPHLLGQDALSVASSYTGRGTGHANDGHQWRQGCPPTPIEGIGPMSRGGSPLGISSDGSVDFDTGGAGGKPGRDDDFNTIGVWPYGRIHGYRSEESAPENPEHGVRAQNLSHSGAQRVQVSNENTRTTRSVKNTWVCGLATRVRAGKSNRSGTRQCEPWATVYLTFRSLLPNHGSRSARVHPRSLQCPLSRHCTPYTLLASVCTR